MGGLNNPVTDCTAAANLSRTWPDFRKKWPDYGFDAARAEIQYNPNLYVHIEWREVLSF